MTLHSPLATPAATRAQLERWGLRSKKSLGQHFLISDNVVGRILALASVSAQDAILEIGPGIGTLTEALLLAGAKVLAVEKDAALLPVLEDLKLRYSNSLSYLHADATELLATALENAQPEALVADQATSNELSAAAPNGSSQDSAALRERERELLSSSRKLVANLPYAVAATAVLMAFEALPNLSSATVMVQREVARRMMAAPGSKDYGAYSVKLQTLVRPSEHFFVAPGNFMPPPRVDSCVIRLNRHSDAKLSPALAKAVFTVANAAFYQRRKTIRNSMCGYFAAQCNRFCPPTPNLATPDLTALNPVAPSPATPSLTASSPVKPSPVALTSATPNLSTPSLVTPSLIDELLAHAKIAPDSRGEQHEVASYRALGQALLNYSSGSSISLE